MAPGSRRGKKGHVPPWHPRILVPAICLGMPFTWVVRMVANGVPKDWRHLPGKLPHLILLWIQEAVQWLAGTFSLEFPIIMWLGLIVIAFSLPSMTKPGFQEKNLEKELAKLEKEVKELAEDLGELNDMDPDAMLREMPQHATQRQESKKTK